MSLTSESGARSDGLGSSGGLGTGADRAGLDGSGTTVERVLLARNAIATIFITVGVCFASWAARLPAIQENLGVSAGQLGLTLLALSVGSVLTLPLAGSVVNRLGPVLTLRITTSTIAATMMLIGFAPSATAVAVLFFFVGAGVGTCDVAMNVSAVDVEQRLGKPLMSRFHGGFSLGTVFGAAIGAAAAALGVPVAFHLLAIGIFALFAFTIATSYLLPLTGGSGGSDQAARTTVDANADPVTAPSGGSRASVASGGSEGGARSAWRERRTLMLGLLVLGMAFSEGTANDWLAIGLRDGYGFSDAASAAGFGLFVTAMTAGRLVGPWVLNRFGRVLALRAGAVAVLIGVFAVGLGTFLPADAKGLAIAVALAGSMIWGWGAALGFPVGMSAAGDDPDRAPARVSVVATIGYLAFIAGPPLLGLLGDHYGTARAILAVTGAVILSFFAASAAAEPKREGATTQGGASGPNAGAAVDNASERGPLG